jgi:hypothetical protein
MFSKALDEGKEIRVIFFDISKVFDRVWHRGLLFKLKKNGNGGCSYIFNGNIIKIKWRMELRLDLSRNNHRFGLLGIDINQPSV